MESDLRLPTHFKEYPGAHIITCFDHCINPRVLDALNVKPFFSRYRCKRFDTKIWRDPLSELWYAEVWIENRYRASEKAQSIQQLAFDIDNKYLH